MNGLKGVDVRDLVGMRVLDVKGFEPTGGE